MDSARRVAAIPRMASLGHQDRMRWLTVAGCAGFAVAVLMALFGLPPVDLHGPFHRAGIMDPFCGGTRAARFTAQGRFVEAWTYNPLGVAAAMAAAAAAVRTAAGLITGRWLNLTVAWTPRMVRIVVVVAVALLVALEIRQQGRSDLLMRTY